MEIAALSFMAIILPALNAGPDQTIRVGASVVLTGPGAATYSWSYGVSNGVAFALASTATYTVTGADANSCSDTCQVPPL